MIRPPSPSDRVGQTLAGKYELVRLLGKGGMGAVYEAVNALIGKRVAVKIITSDALGEVARQRLFREARAATAIRHPHVVDVLDVAVDAELGPFIVMELLHGESLEDRLARLGPMPLAEARELLAPVCEALQSVHQAGVVHRDIKPSNIFLHEDAKGRTIPKLVDFGIAIAEGPRLTRTGSVAGTWGYMAPEQMNDAKRADARSDVWALAVVVYECLSGVLPFPGTTHVEIVANVIGGRRTPLESVAPFVPADVVAAVHLALRHNPEERPQTVSEFAERIGFATEPMIPRRGAISQSSPRASHPPRVAATVAVGAGLLVVLAGAAVSVPVVLRNWRSHPLAPSAGVAPVRPAAAIVKLDAKGVTPADRRVVPGGQAWLGSSPDEARSARAACVAEVGASNCPAQVFDAEARLRTEDVRPFRLDVHEIANDQLAAWAAALELHLEMDGDQALWVAAPFGRLFAIAGTRARLAGFALEGGRVFVRPGFGDRPAVWTTREAARRFCEDAHGRLPTAAEWEWAARGPERRRYPWGNALFGCHRAVAARAGGLSCGAEAQGPVSVIDPLQDKTPDGVAGLAGNVAEWVADPADTASAGPSNVDNEAGATCEPGGCFEVKGGDWASPAWAVRAAAIRAARADFVSEWLGWRCAADAP